MNNTSAVEANTQAVFPVSTFPPLSRFEAARQTEGFVFLNRFGLVRFA